MTQLTEENRSVIGDIVKRSAARSPKDTAIVFQDRTWTYSQLDQAVTNIARFFVEHGLEKATALLPTARTPTSSPSSSWPVHAPDSSTCRSTTS